MIYEAHIKDISRQAEKVPYDLRGTYLGAAESGKGTPLGLIQDLGVNAVEWLPLADYDHIEPTFDDPSLPVHNTWNPYAFNHWGYMPAYYFAPEARYAYNNHLKADRWIGSNGAHVQQLRSLVQTLHRSGLAVIFDVVYNHVAQYGENPLRQIDPYYSLRYDREGRRQSVSGCGNDLRTERPMIRRLILDSLKHWMKVYGADGFRFDLAGLIDAETLAAITRELRGIKPDLHLIAEPWGGRYDKGRFSRVRWASWNDHFRDGIRGTDPEYGKGYIFGQWSPRDSGDAMLRHVRGNLREDGGPYDHEEHCVNFISCHDGHPIGNFVRVGGEHMNHETNHNSVGKPRSAYRVLSGRDDRRIRLSSLLLLTSRGSVMLHQGDEWGRAKVIEGRSGHDPERGKLDHNSYEKDDPTNWVDWEELDSPANRKLRDYTRGLIAIRRRHPALRLATRGDVELLSAKLEFAFGYRISVARDDMIVLANADPTREATFDLPPGRWRVLADHLHADPERSVGGVRERAITLGPVAGAVLHQPFDASP
ncbi:DUF3459 domain-containing protein, partial [bacterium]|nr:DUF3459 domain-containing protein [bacterium]